MLIFASVKKFRHILRVTFALILCLQMFNICVYLPSWMYPGVAQGDLTESVIELIVEGATGDQTTMYSERGNSTNAPTINEEILEDLHPPEEYGLALHLQPHTPVAHNYYHFTPDIKTHVFSVVYPPPDFC